MVTLLLAFYATSVFWAWVLLAWWHRAGKARKAREQLAPPEARPDYRVLVPVQRACPDCGAAFERNPAVVEPLCDACVARRFAASEVRDKVEWMAKGWEER